MRVLLLLILFQFSFIETAAQRSRFSITNPHTRYLDSISLYITFINDSVALANGEERTDDFFYIFTDNSDTGWKERTLYFYDPDTIHDDPRLLAFHKGKFRISPFDKVTLPRLPMFDYSRRAIEVRRKAKEEGYRNLRDHLSRNNCGFQILVKARLPHLSEMKYAASNEFRDSTDFFAPLEPGNLKDAIKRYKLTSSLGKWPVFPCRYDIHDRKKKPVSVACLNFIGSEDYFYFGPKRIRHLYGSLWEMTSDSLTVFGGSYNTPFSDFNLNLVKPFKEKGEDIGFRFAFEFTIVDSAYLESGKLPDSTILKDQYLMHLAQQKNIYPKIDIREQLRLYTTNKRDVLPFKLSGKVVFENEIVYYDSTQNLRFDFSGIPDSTSIEYTLASGRREICSSFSRCANKESCVLGCLEGNLDFHNISRLFIILKNKSLKDKVYKFFLLHEKFRSMNFKN